MPPRKQPSETRPKPRYRTRYEPPTLQEAIFAAQGLSDDLAAQVEIAASLTGLAAEEVRPQVLQRAAQRRAEQHTVVTRRFGMAHRVVVERKPPRRLQAPRPVR